jgi:hypothetical protein
MHNAFTELQDINDQEVIMKKQLLFVTDQHEDSADGFSYAMDLARAMKEDITILLVQKKNLIQRIEDMMVAITFAEANEHETAREILTKDPVRQAGSSAQEKLWHLVKQCHDLDIDVTVHTVSMDAVSGVKDFLKKRNGVDMVLLSPSVTANGNVTGKELNRLVRTASRPIVTMARQAYAV